MFTSEQYRAKAAEYTELVKRGDAPNEVREFHKLEGSLTMLADNEQWLADNHDKLAKNLEEMMHGPEQSAASELEDRAGVSELGGMGTLGAAFRHIV